MPSTFMPEIKNEADLKLESGVRVRFYRQEPFKFMNEIHKWMEGLKIGEVQAFHMNTDVNGWVNLAIAYREVCPPKPQGPDMAMVLYDTVMVLHDLTEVVSKLEEKLFPSKAAEVSEGAP